MISLHRLALPCSRELDAETISDISSVRPWQYGRILMYTHPNPHRMNRHLLGRRVGAVTQLPHDGPVVVTGIEGEHRGALQFRREIETEVDNGDAMVPSESPGRTDLSVVSDVAHG